MSIGTFREWLREGELYKVGFTDPMGNKTFYHHRVELQTLQGCLNR